MKKTEIDRFLSMKQNEQLEFLTLSNLSKDEFNELYREFMLTDIKNVKTLRKFKEMSENMNVKLITDKDVINSSYKALLTLINYKNLFNKDLNKEELDREFEYIYDTLDFGDKIIHKDSRMFIRDKDNLEDICFSVVAKSNYFKNLDSKKLVAENKLPEEFLKDLSKRYLSDGKTIESKPYFVGYPVELDTLKGQKDIIVSDNPEFAKENIVSDENSLESSAFTVFIVNDENIKKEKRKFNEKESTFINIKEVNDDFLILNEDEMEMNYSLFIKEDLGKIIKEEIKKEQNLGKEDLILNDKKDTNKNKIIIRR